MYEKVMKTKKYSFGLYSIAERIENFDGSMEITSQQCQGTRIVICIPVDFHGASLK